MTIDRDIDEPSNGWTFRTLKEYFETMIGSLTTQFDQRYETSQKAIETAFNALSESTRAAMASADKAVLKAEAASEKRFESVNEFRSLVTDQQATFMPRKEAESAIGTLEDKIDEMRRIYLQSSGEKKGSHDVVIYIIVVLTILIDFGTMLVMLFKR